MINYISYTDEFATFADGIGGQLKCNTPTVSEEFLRNIYGEILKNAYHIDGQFALPEPMVQSFYEVNGVKHYFKVIKRNQFAEILIDGELPTLQQEWINYASGGIESFTELTVPLPFEKFILEGFLIFSILPETEEIALKELNKIVANLHVNDSDTAIDQLRESTLSLIGNDTLTLGFLPILKINDNFVYHDAYARSSIVFGRLKYHFKSDELSNIYNYMAEYSFNNTSILGMLNNDVLDNCTDASQLHIRKVFDAEGITALKFIPIWHNNVLLGIIELGVKDENDINIGVLKKLDAALPIFREFFLHKTNTFYNYLNSFIMQRYTSIQRSVAWKFNEEVWDAVKNTKTPTDPVSTPPVRFENLYPFYGAIDIRNSSQKQIRAIHNDFKVQLQYLERLLDKEIPLGSRRTDDISEKVRFWSNHLDDDIDIHEGNLRQFLDIDSVSFLNELSKEGILSQSVAREYRWAVSSKFGKFHEFHNQYEESIQEINRVLKEELLRADETLQESIPHYFEKFQTDGIEFSLYAGEEINPSYLFSSESIKTIIDWQIDVILAMAIAADNYKESLRVPLETTQLILIHENTVNISYRVDERHFDVEGSYSIRYQVLKKRIDKVRLLNSNERLTQPGTLAIVYSNDESLYAYLEKIKRLIADEKLLPGIEYLELEQLQGIGKLKAVRLKINMSSIPTNTLHDIHYTEGVRIPAFESQ